MVVVAGADAGVVFVVGVGILGGITGLFVGGGIIRGAGTGAILLTGTGCLLVVVLVFVDDGVTVALCFRLLVVRLLVDEVVEAVDLFVDCCCCCCHFCAAC